MPGKMSVILCGVILGCGINVFANTGEKGSVGVVSSNNVEEVSVSADRVTDVFGMDITGEAGLGNVSGDGISEREEDHLEETASANEALEGIDEISVNEILGEIDEIVSANEVLEGTDEIVSANEVLEGTDEIVSANEILEGTDEIVSADEVPEKSEAEEKIGGGEGTVSGGDKDQRSEDEDRDETVVKVSFPEKILIYLDPKDLLGKGHIYSDEYKIVNYGNSDVVVRIKTTDVFYKNKKHAQENPNVEDLDVRMVWDDKKNMEKPIDAAGENDVYFLHLKASKYDEKNEFVKLSDGSEISFHFAGEINGDADAQWNVDDLGLQLSYKIEKMKDTEDQGKRMLVENEAVSENKNEQYRLE